MTNSIKQRIVHLPEKEDFLVDFCFGAMKLRLVPFGRIGSLNGKTLISFLKDVM